MHNKKNQPWLSLACWAFLFTPALFEGVSAASVGLWLASAALFWMVSLWRPALLLAMVSLVLLGVVNTMHIGFFGNLADQMLLATALRTNWEESREFMGVLPPLWVALSLLWLVLAVLASKQLWKAVSQLQPRGALRKLAWGALVVWVVFAAFVLVKRYSFEEVTRKVKTLYPMHIVRAWTAQRQLSEALFYQPVLPAQAPAQTVDTVVVVLGESASAQRWSLLGYEAADTNAPLKNLQGLQAIRAMSHGLNTAATLPYLLTGMAADDSVQHKAPSYMDMAKQAGYKVFVISNSRYHSSQEDFYGVTLRRSADVFLKAGNGEWDEVLTPHLQSALADPAPRKLIVLHTYGSHFQVEERYPQDKAVFDDAYDNTLHYTSSLLAQWIADLDRSAGADRTAMLLYSSDHGVAMPPCADQYRTGSGLSSLQVPLLVWGNPRLRAQAPQLWPVFDEQERQTVHRSNASLAEIAAAATGYPQALQLPQDSPAKQLLYQGKSWSELQKLDACNLK